MVKWKLMKFDGREFARKIIEDLKKLNTKKKLVVIYNPEHKPSRVYTNIKERVAQELGVEFIKVPVSEIKDFNNYADADGIMVQTPLGDKDLENKIIGMIDPKKDVDGLREDSPYLPAVVRAVKEILSLGEGNARGEVVIVGSKGFVGKKLIKVLSTQYSVSGMDIDDFSVEKLKTADVVISATGQKDLIDSDMVRDRFIAIDVGYPDAEFTQNALNKASFYTPVPGGVGPVTVAMLFKNLAEQANERWAFLPTYPEN